jgi:LysM repeat protein
MKRTTTTIGLGGLVLAISCLVAVADAARQPETQPGASQFGSESPYVVKKGDTLWGISRDLLQDPLLWRRLWERNRFIDDPNRIYPGDQLNLPGKELAPEAAPVAEAPKPEPPKPEPTAPEPPKERVEAPPPPAPPAPVEAKPAPQPEPPLPPASQHAMVCSPVLIAEGDAATVGLGELVKSREDRLLNSTEDRVVLGLDAGRSVSAGDRLAVLSVGRRIVHPQTGALAGRVLYVLGLLEVTDVMDRVAQARVSYSCAPIRVGDRIAQFVPARFPEEETPKPAKRSVSAAVIAALRGEAIMGLQQVAFVDVGADHGIAAGDVFSLLRPNPPARMASTGATLPMPSERLGDAVVIRVAERSATVVLTASSREVRIGDRAVLSYQIAP